MRKPIYGIAAALAITLSLAACGGTPTSAGKQGDGQTGSSGTLAAGPGFDGKTINIGVLNPTSGPLGAGAGQPIIKGIEYRIKRINEAGGIAGKYPIELKIADTEYDPQTAIQAYTGMQGDVVMVASVLGTGVVKGLLPKFRQDQLLAIPATDASAWVREENLLPTRPTYESAFINGLSYAYNDAGGKTKKYCTLRQDDASGQAYNDGITFGAKEIGASITKEVAFPNATTDFTPQVQQLKAAGCDVVFFAAAAPLAQGVIAASVQLDFTPKWLSLASGVPLHLMGSPSADYISANWLVSTPGAQWGDESVSGMAELVADFKKYGNSSERPDAALWPVGYDYGIAVETLLERAVADGDLSPGHVLEISQSKDFTIDFKGLTPAFTYGPAKERTPPTEVTIFAVDPAVPGFLKTVAKNVDSPAAKAFGAK